MKKWWHRQSLLLLILGLAFLLRLPHLNGSFWLDEAAQALESARPAHEQFQIADDFQPPLLHLLTFIALRLGKSEAWLRLIGAVLPSLLTILYFRQKTRQSQSGRFSGTFASDQLLSHLLQSRVASLRLISFFCCLVVAFFVGSDSNRS